MNYTNNYLKSLLIHVGSVKLILPRYLQIILLTYLSDVSKQDLV